MIYSRNNFELAGASTRYNEAPRQFRDEYGYISADVYFYSMPRGCVAAHVIDDAS